MAVLARKKQILAPDVEGLINSLTTVEKDEEGFQELEKWVFSNIIHHSFATVDIFAVKKSLEGIAEKLRLHGLDERAKRFEHLVEKYVTSDTSSHSQLNVQWHVLLLLLKLAHNPASVPDEALQCSEDGSSAQDPADDIDWPRYLKEGQEEFCCPSDTSDEDEWGSSSEEETCEPERVAPAPELPSLGDIPHPALWHLHQPPPPSRQEVMRRIIWEGVEGEQWLKAHSQNAWWSDTTVREPSESPHPIAHMCDIWLDHLQKEDPTVTLQIHQLSEYNVIHEVLWMLQVPSDMGLFRLTSDGHFHVKPGLSLHTTIPDTTQLVLRELCPYFDVINNLRQFEQGIQAQELSDNPPPVTYKAYSAALYQQLNKFYQLVIGIEERHCAQEETMTLLTVTEELRPGLDVILYLHLLHTRAVLDHTAHPHWLCATRLLSVLYESILEASEPQFAAPSVDLFLHSFHVYLDIIDVWLSEGRLEDWRREFLVISEGDVVKVMPYEEEMRRSGVAGVQLLSRLVGVVREAGDTMEVVSLLNKLPELRENVHNRGCLFKEFSQNVYDTIERYNEKISEEESESEEEEKKMAEIEEDHMDSEEDNIGQEKDEENEAEEIEVNVENVAKEEDENKGEEEIKEVVEVEEKITEEKDKNEQDINNMDPLDSIILAEEAFPFEQSDSQSSYLSCDKEARASPPDGEPQHLVGEGGTGDRKMEDRPDFLRLVSSQDIIDRKMPVPTDNPYLAAAFYYINPHMRPGSPDPPGGSLRPRSADNLGEVGMMCAHALLQAQLGLVETRYRIASHLVTSTLHTEYCLMQHLAVLRNVFFMESANLAQAFYSHLFKEIESSSKLNSVELSVQLQSCVREYFPDFANYFSVTVAHGNWSKAVHQAIPAISIDYKVDWPVSSVITPAMIDSYNKVFRFLLHLKCAFWTLEQLRISDWSGSGSGPESLLARRLQVLRLWMYHSTNTLHFYFLGLVLRSYSADMQQSLQQAHSVLLIVEAHKKFLDQVKVHCLQQKKNDLERLIIMLLQLCSSLAVLWGRRRGVTDADVQRLEKRYLAVFRAVATILETITDNMDHLDNPLCELKNEIMHSIPEGCYEDT